MSLINAHTAGSHYHDLPLPENNQMAEHAPLPHHWNAFAKRRRQRSRVKCCRKPKPIATVQLHRRTALPATRKKTYQRKTPSGRTGTLKNRRVVVSRSAAATSNHIEEMINSSRHALAQNTDSIDSGLRRRRQILTIDTAALYITDDDAQPREDIRPRLCHGCLRRAMPLLLLFAAEAACRL
jgi:hypothetical protein